MIYAAGRSIVKPHGFPALSEDIPLRRSAVELEHKRAFLPAYNLLIAYRKIRDSSRLYRALVQLQRPFASDNAAGVLYRLLFHLLSPDIAEADIRAEAEVVLTYQAAFTREEIGVLVCAECFCFYFGGTECY